MNRLGTTPPEPATSHVIRTIIDIDAPPERVFDALTDPAELAEWWGGDDETVRECEAEVRPGGSWTVHTVDRDGTERTTGGEYRVVDPPRRLEHTWHSTGDPGESIVRYDLEPLGVDGAGGTRLTVTHTSPVMLATATPLTWTSSLLRLMERLTHSDPVRVLHADHLHAQRHRAVQPRRAHLRHLLAPADGSHHLPWHADR